MADKKKKSKPRKKRIGYAGKMSDIFKLPDDVCMILTLPNNGSPIPTGIMNVRFEDPDKDQETDDTKDKDKTA